MNTPTKLLAVGALALAVFSAPAAHAQSGKASSQTTTAQDFSVPVTEDNQIWYRDQPFSHDPFDTYPGRTSKAYDVNKSLIHFEHTDTGGIVWNSWTVTGLFADQNELSGQAGPPNGTGSVELYSTYRGDISATGFGHAPIAFWGVTDLQFEFGGDLNWKNDAYQARRKFLLIGPNFVLDLPGSVTFAVHYAKEFNHNGLINQEVEFHPTWNTELSYTEYFDDDRLLRLEGVFNMTGTKGEDQVLVDSTPFAATPNFVRTPVKFTTEFYTYNSIILDAGQLLNLPPHRLDIFTGLQYWVHKFGYPTRADAGAVELAPYFGLGIHF